MSICRANNRVLGAGWAPLGSLSMVSAPPRYGLRALGLITRAGAASEALVNLGFFSAVENFSTTPMPRRTCT